MSKEIKAACGNCSSQNVFGISRVVGYYSIIENWNDSKKAELNDRQNGSYKLTDNIEMKKEEAILCVK